MKIYTRRGDDGSTGLFGGGRVSKADLRVEAYGLLDELNAVLGWARIPRLPQAVEQILSQTQDACFRLGAWLASRPGADPGVDPLASDDVEVLEEAIDLLESDLAPLTKFILPGGGEGGARLHMARTVARRAERAIVALGADGALPPLTLAWTNRLSDYLFVAARATNAADRVPEATWSARP